MAQLTVSRPYRSDTNRSTPVREYTGEDWLAVVYNFLADGYYVEFFRALMEANPDGGRGNFILDFEFHSFQFRFTYTA